jgi:hypothetical protein
MTELVWPNGSTTVPAVSSEFGMRYHPISGVHTLHAGIDLVKFDINKSPVTGTVTFAGWNGGAGIEVRVRADGPNAFLKGDVFRILHNARLLVSQGQRVSVGQDVGVQGSTGASTGKHCHLETRPGGGNAINPRDYYANAYAQGAGGGSTPLPPSGDLKGDDVFVISNNIPNHPQKGAAWIAVPQGAGKPRATVLLGGDNFPGVPVIQFVNKGSWDNFAPGIQWA